MHRVQRNPEPQIEGNEHHAKGVLQQEAEATPFLKLLSLVFHEQTTIVLKLVVKPT